MILDKRYKMSSTTSHIYFLTGPFSQWDPSDFRARLPAIEGLCAQSEEMDFNCCEQFMMAGKAHVFGDRAALDAIMAVEPLKGESFNEVPRKQKALGREVKNFNPVIWDSVDFEIVLAGNIAKFSQSATHRQAMKETGEKILVEGAHYDKIWGVGLAWNDPRILDESNWRGQNKLGRVLMRTRTILF